MASVKQLQLELITCPICFDALKPPVTTCLNGHGVCANCRPKIKICPLCNGNFSAVKNTLLNQMIESVLFTECKNSANGCKEQRPSISDMKEHEKVCNYELEMCCACGKGKILSLEMNNHFKTHPKSKYNVMFGESFSHQFNCVRPKDHYYLYLMAFIKNIDEHFLIRLSVKQKERQISILIQYTGKKEEANNYGYCIKMNQKPSSNKPCYFTCNGICVPYFYPLKDIDSHPRVIKLDLKSIFLDDSYDMSKVEIFTEINPN